MSPKKNMILLEHLEEALNDLGWNNVKDLVKSKRKFKKIFSQGGYQFKAVNLPRAIQIISDNYDDSDLHFIFLKWCEKIKIYDEVLDSLFSADDDGKEYEKSSHKLDKKLFTELLNNLRYNHSEKFIYLSPFTFTKSQKKLLADKNTELQKKIKGPKKTNPKSISEISDKDFKNEIKELKATIRSNKKEIRNIEKENQNFKTQINNLGKKLEESQNLTIEYEEKLLSIEEINAENETRYTNKLNKNRSNYKKVIEDKNYELDELKDKNLNLSDELLKRSNELKALNDELKSQKDLFYKKVTYLFEQVNSVEIIGALNEPDEVKDLISSVVQVPQNDHSLSLESVDTFFKKSWFNMVRQELKTIRQLSNIDINILIDNNFSKAWPDYKDLLVDLKYSLKARATLLNLIAETMMQFFREEYYPSDKPKSLKTYPAKSSHRDISILKLSNQTKMKLLNAGYHSVEKFVGKYEKDLFRIRTFGRKNLNEVKSALAKVNIRLKK